MKYPFPVAMPPDVLHAAEQTYIFITGENYLAELRTTVSAMPTRADPFAPSTQDAWWQLGMDVEAALPAQIPDTLPAIVSSLQSALGPLPQFQNGVEMAIGHVLGLLHPDESQAWGPPGAFAVSPLWKRRMGTLIGGELYPAWIGSVTLPS